MSNPYRPTGPGNTSFLPEDYIRSKAEGRANIITLTLFALVLAGVMGAFVVTKASVEKIAKRKEFVNQQFQEAEKKIAQLKSLESQQAQMMEKAEITSALVEKVPRWAVLGELTLRMPADMRLDSLVIKSTRPKVEVAPPPGAKPPAVKSLAGKFAAKVKPEAKEPERVKPQVPRFTYALTLEGTAVKNQDIADYLASLKQSPVLDKVEMAFIRESSERGSDYRKFQVTAQLRTELDTTGLAQSLSRLVAERTRWVAEQARADGAASAAASEKE
ncbi:MAG: PilN domain-containing protein [Planctomycetota bacterium]|nr:PilN domain-containing protein [Planctomycetota bacterium]